MSTKILSPASTPAWAPDAATITSRAADRYHYSSSTLAPGITAGDATVNAFHELLVTANAQQDAAEGFFSSQALGLEAHGRVLEKLFLVVQEERRCVESQLHECHTQVASIKENKKYILVESDRLVQYLTAELSRLDREEDALDDQHDAVDARTTEMTALMKKLDAKLDQLKSEGAEIKAVDAGLAQDERVLEAKRLGLQKTDRDLEVRLHERGRKEDSIQMWATSLEGRELDNNRHQNALLGRLRQLESEERSLGIDKLHKGVASRLGNSNSDHGSGSYKNGGGVGGYGDNPHNNNYNNNIINNNGNNGGGDNNNNGYYQQHQVDGVTSVRALMDDHGMSIDREVEREEIDGSSSSDDDLDV